VLSWPAASGAPLDFEVVTVSVQLSVMGLSPPIGKIPHNNALFQPGHGVFGCLALIRDGNAFMGYIILS
jgi:hypothetical protein